ncbi:MAG: hypothetical protein ACW99A_19645, partial [Candidatus Kariarchaeaceae archaeon]
MSQSSFVRLFRFGKFTKFFVIIFLLIGSALFLSPSSAENRTNSTEVDVDIDTSFEIEYSQQANQKMNVKKLDKNVKTSTSSDNSESLNIFDSFTPNGALLETQERSEVNSDLPFTYNEKFTNSSTHLESNDETFRVLPVANNTLSQLDGNITTYVPSSEVTIEDDTTSNDLDYSGGSSYAQAVNMTFYNGSSSTFIESFYISVTFASAGSFIGEIWTSQHNGTHIVPDTMVATKTETTGGILSNANLTFSFTSPAEIKSGDTYTVSNNHLGYVFFIIYRPAVVAAVIDYDDQADGQEDAITYSSPTSSPPASSAWVDETYEITMGYDVYYELDPTLIDSTVNVDSDLTVLTVAADNSFTDSITRTGDTTYRVNYNSTKASNLSVAPFFNVTYISQATLISDTNVKYTITPNQSNVDWIVQFDSSYTNSSANITKYFTIHSNFTITGIYLNETELSETPGEYSNGTDVNGNQIIYFEVAHGNYSIFAKSTNLLQYSVVRSFIDNTGWEERNNGTMGVLYPILSEAAGNTVKSNVTNIGLLSGGSVNASLRDPTGIIFGNQTVGSYLDTSDFSTTFDFSGLMEFTTVLDPNVTTGYWSFQFRWYNGTSAGGVALEFIVLPFGSIDLVSPSTSHIDVLEGDIIDIEIETLDHSHNDNWVSIGVVNWDLEAPNQPLTSNGLNTLKYNYTYSIDTNVANGLKTNTNYTINISFTDGPFTISIEFTIRVFYRASTQIVPSDPIEYFTPLDIEFTAINETGGGSLLNSSFILFNLTSN